MGLTAFNLARRRAAEAAADVPPWGDVPALPAAETDRRAELEAMTGLAGRRELAAIARGLEIEVSRQMPATELVEAILAAEAEA